MGYVDDIQGMELSDEVKADLIARYEADTRPQRLAGRKANAETAVEKLRKMGFSEEAGCTGFLKRFRRILMSDDAYEPAAVLMSDTDLELSGEAALGATSREEVNLADEVSNLINLLPGASEGKLKIQLSEQALSAEEGARPSKDGDDSVERLEEARTSLNKVTGQAVSGGVSRSRYRRGGHKVAAGGEK